ncbi:MAG: short-chain dehydrogenase/reductase [Sphingomonas sp. SCN 67-18]|uniref:oxidoreductase n=1 Tax=uncultured Sphingomonas sp. TaxID=158754 RepID=UPI00086862A9|nr:oxidoreductase [Sphingomonas sp. SCN 67-18]ODU22428.1 MAG: short-chain dehydrogenase/reductase [Sphingomonas sp. SCN 67-18]
MSKNWFITGVSSGFGRAIADAALARGDRVFGTVRKEEDRLAFEAASPGRATGLILDVRDDAAVRRVVDAAAADGGIDVLVNNAGYCLVGAVEEAGIDELRAQMDVNFFGAVSVLQAVLPHMRAKRSGHIFNITSVSGIAAWMGIGFYCASKHALEAIGKALAQEVAGLGIRVTNVEPGAFRTGFNRAGALSRAAAVIEDYAPTSGLAWDILSHSAGKEAGDPALAARAILTALDAESAPLHLLLGSDAVFYAGREQAALAAEMTRWMPVTIAVNHADTPPTVHS